VPKTKHVTKLMRNHTTIRKSKLANR